MGVGVAIGKSVSAWVRDEHIAIDVGYAIELAGRYGEDSGSDVCAFVTYEDGDDYVFYTGLDSICMDEHLFCNISSDGIDSDAGMVVGRDHYLYIMDCCTLNGDNTGVIKVGVSRFPKRRAEQLNEAWRRKGIRFDVRRVSKGSWSRRKVYATESAIHNVLRHKGLQYDPGCKYDGYSELFYDKIWIESLI